MTRPRARPTRTAARLLIQGAEEWIEEHGRSDDSWTAFTERASEAWRGAAIMWEDPGSFSGPRWIASLPSTGHFVYSLHGYKPGVDPEEDNANIYVGVTSNLRQRLYAHSRKWWWAAVVPDMSQFLEEPTRQEAEALERRMIHDYQPAMNRAGRLLVVTSS